MNPMRVIAVVDGDPQVVEKILRHLGAWHDPPPRPPPSRFLGSGKQKVENRNAAQRCQRRPSHGSQQMQSAKHGKLVFSVAEPANAAHDAPCGEQLGIRH